MAPTRQTPVPRGTLNRERIAEAALALVDRDGAEALTMRRVAAELGSQPMSLYRHVDGREGLLDALFDAYVARLQPVDRDLPWDERLRAFARDTRTVALAHPEAFRLVANRPARSAAVLELSDALVGAFRAAGLSADRAVSAMRLLGSFILGYLLDEMALPPTAGGRWSPPDVADLPNLAAVAPALGKDRLAAHYEAGVELVIAGVRAQKS
jgi:TetR/AcrR family tetracycline transcriptional repressor